MKTLKELKKERAILISKRDKKMDKVDMLNDQLDMIENDLRWTISKIKKLEGRGK